VRGKVRGQRLLLRRLSLLLVVDGVDKDADHHNGRPAPGGEHLNAGVAEVTIKKIEAGTTDDPRSKTLDAIERAFEKAGVVFLEPGDVRDGGEGLRLKKARRR
jgi:hypothetical protein